MSNRIIAIMVLLSGILRSPIVLKLNYILLLSKAMWLRVRLDHKALKVSAGFGQVRAG